ncbi:hypothetical protein BU16DRAFT_536629 [Lophium mytilinum]|uniref:Uncharacterized protein n=1 Tax=Lophium mytilinum TaxID=390894 RepID=A0A6A6R284_9PEZI|nr:hypothetical protein BU16DRAFT_536629 [Lophium mytilinum]
MASYKNLQDDTWSDVETKPRRSNHIPEKKIPTDGLLEFKEPLRWHLRGLLFYSIGILALLGWVYSGPSYDRWSRRVLRTGNLKVDQFYSGVASVAIFVPVAALVGQICLEFGLLHPFSIAHRTPVSAADLDRMIDTGPFSLLTVWKYSRARAAMLATIMLIGTAIVPVSSLLLNVDWYSPQTHQHGVVGLPVLQPAEGLLSMSKMMGYSGSGPLVSHFDETDFVLEMITDTHKGAIISRRGGLSTADAQLGPISTMNISFSQGVQYTGLVSFTWSSACENANDEIHYTAALSDDKPSVNFTWPDGTTNTTTPGNMPIFMWSASPKTPSGIPLGGTTYIAQASLMRNYTPSALSTADGITPAPLPGVWISRVKCTPAMRWHVSACTADGRAMQNCSDAAGANTTALDTVALDTLSGYMTAVPWLLYLRNDYTFRMTLEPFYVMPTTGHYERILGVLAESIAAVATAGYFGTATVATVGEEPRLVYVVRVYVLFILLGLVYVVVGLSAADLGYSRAKRLPFRKATFLTIAYAVHGRGVDWDDGCGCVMSRAELRRRNQMELRYGIDVKDRLHVGFAGEVKGWGGRGEDEENGAGDREEEGYEQIEIS